MSIGTRTFVSALALFFGTAMAGSAATISIDTNTDDQFVIMNGLSEKTSVQGIDFVGANVTIGYGDGSFSNLVWQAISKFGGGVSTADATLAMVNGPIVMDTTKLVTSILFDAAGADTVFDILTGKSDLISSVGSSVGHPFRIELGDPGEGEIKATYSGAVTLYGYEQRPDLFTRMLVDFSGLASGGILGHLEFGSDLDNVKVAGDIIPVSDMSDVPLPASMPLLFAGLAGLGFLRRRRS